jgi:hypothetical protein
MSTEYMSWNTVVMLQGSSQARGYTSGRRQNPAKKEFLNINAA